MRTMPLILLAVALGCGPSPTRPQPAPEPSAPEPTLKNGLRVHVVPRPGTGVVAVELAWAGGARTAAEHPAAPAVLLEQALGGAGQPGLRQAIEALGGSADGRAGPADVTLGFTVAADRLQPALAALGQALAGDGEPPESVLKRLAAAQASARAGADRRALERLVAEAAPGMPTALPGQAALDGLTVETLPALRKRRWQPQGAHLVVVGDVTTPDALAAVEDALSAWSGDGSAPPAAPMEPQGPRVVAEASDAQHLWLAWQVPVPDGAAAAALDVLAGALSGPQGRLAEALRATGARAPAPSAFPLLVGAGQALLVAHVQAPADQAWAAVIHAAHGLARRPPGPGRIATLRLDLRAQRARREDAPAAEARRLALLHAHWPQGAAAYDRGLAALHPDDLARTARALAAPNLTALVQDRIPGDVDPALWAEGLAEKAAAPPAPDRARRPGLIELAEGTEAVLAPVPGARALTVLALLESGPDEGGGLAPMVAAALAAPDDVGPTVQAEAGPDHLRVWITVAPDDLEVGLAALAGRLRGFQFTPARLAWARAALAAADAEPARRADRLAHGLLFPQAHLAGDADASPAELRAWYADRVLAAPLRLVLVGALRPETARAALEPLVLAGRRPLAPAAPAPDASPQSPQAARETTDSDRGELRVLWRAPLDAADALAQAHLLAELLVAPDGPLLDFLRRDGRGGRARPLVLADGPVGLVGVAIDGPVSVLAQAAKAARSGAAKAGSVSLPVDALRAVQRRAVARLRRELAPTHARARWLAGHARTGRALLGDEGWRAFKSALERLGSDEAAAAARAVFARDGQLTVEIGAPRTAARSERP
ncbi:MAG: insulinase family protein [Myxococcales bacterium]|nr:insulinase family protein [Myxococcales bacterium]